MKRLMTNAELAGEARACLQELVRRGERSLEAPLADVEVFLDRATWALRVECRAEDTSSDDN